MNEKEKRSESGDNVIFADWVQNQVSVWEQAWKQRAQVWHIPPETAPEDAGESGKQPSFDEIGKGLFEFFQALFSLAGTPNLGEIQSVKSVPDLILKMFQPFWTHSIKLQKQWVEMTGATATGETESLAELFKQITKAFYDTQAEEFHNILNIPQLGLNRYSQEHFNITIEKTSDFQSALTEFLQLLMIPVEKCCYGVQEEMARMEKEGNEALKDSQALYQLWIQKLEDHYMKLLRSDNYLNMLRETLNCLHDYRIARAESFIDLLRDLPIPTNKEMDELYKDLYILKKRVKEIERKVK